jgi:uncharacterized protein HemY
MRALGPIRRGRGATRKGALEMGAGRFGELRAQRTANAGAQRTLPGMNAFEPGKAARRCRRLLAEAVRVLDLLEELNGVQLLIETNGFAWDANVRLEESAK